MIGLLGRNLAGKLSSLHRLWCRSGSWQGRTGNFGKSVLRNALGALTLVVDKLAELRETFSGVGVEVVAGDALLAGEGGQVVHLAEGNGEVFNALAVVDYVLIGAG